MKPGNQESVVAVHSVKTNANNGGIRWYELRDTDGPGGAGWSVRQQSTFAPDSDHRWMGSIAQNGNGARSIGRRKPKGI